MKEMKVPVNTNADIDKARYSVPFDLPPQDAVKNIVGQAICHVNGVLGLKGRLGDVFKRDNDVTRGITLRDGDTMEIRARIIVDDAQNPKQVVEEVQQSILRALYEGAGIQLVQLAIEVDELMDRKSFYGKYGPDRTCRAATSN